VDKAKKDELIKAVIDQGETCLDSVVHDLKSMEGSAINNSGAGSQVDFIIEQCGEEVGLRMIEEALHG
jgi:hypothetical protein